MIGIYKITNNINNHCYIGQSRNITKRFNSHINYHQSVKNYPLYRAFRKYGLENFSFEILEECSINELNERERFWILNLNPEYNQTIETNYSIVPQKLNLEQVKEIQQILIADKSGSVNHKILGEYYGVSADTIQAINAGRMWIDDTLTYPLHISKFAQKQHKYCKDCGIEIYRTSTRCNACEAKHRKETYKLPVTREELKQLIYEKSFTAIGDMYGVSDNAIKKWCKKYNLPHLKKDIKHYTKEKWQNI